jgi:hypothetical protein
MLRRAPVVVVGLLLAGCACRPRGPCPPCDPCAGVAPSAAIPWTGEPPTIAPPRPAPYRTSKPAPPTPEERLAAVTKAEDPLHALLALSREAPDVLRDAADNAWAPFLSDRLRLVDLRDVTRDGGDAPPYAPGPTRGPLGDPDDGVDPRIERIAADVRSALGEDAWDAASTLLVARPSGLVVVQAPERWIDVEKALDRVAVAGGPSARIAALASEDADALAEALGVDGGGWTQAEAGRTPEVPGIEGPALVALQSWECTSLDDAAWARAEALAAVPVVRIPVAGDRRVAAGRTSRTAYVQDFEVEVPPGNVEVPVVGTLVAGTVAHGWRVGDRWRVYLLRGEVLQPIPTFEASGVAGGGPTLRIELPEMRLVRFGADVPDRAGSAVLVRGSAGGPQACLFRVETHEDGTTPRPAWTWWKPPAPTPPWAPFGHTGEYGWPVALRIERRVVGAASGPLATPTLLLTEGEEGVVTVQEEEAYVAGGELAPSGGPNVVDPVIGRVVTGLAVRAKVLPQGDGSAIVEGRLRIEDCDRPMRTFTAGPAGGALSFHLPRTWRTDIPFRVRLRPGEATEIPAVVRGAGGLEHMRLRLSLGERVRLFTPWGGPHR